MHCGIVDVSPAAQRRTSVFGVTKRPRVLPRPPTQLPLLREPVAKLRRAGLDWRYVAKSQPVLTHPYQRRTSLQLRPTLGSCATIRCRRSIGRLDARAGLSVCVCEIGLAKAACQP